jgi:hypothetical protein
MTFTNGLGKRYLWVDAICIDQDNGSEIAAQCDVMDDIYTRSWATLVVLSADSAHDGIELLHSPRPLAQIRATIGPHDFMSLSSTLRHEMESSTWYTRAWYVT